jgi:hypothetical protein
MIYGQRCCGRFNFRTCGATAIIAGVNGIMLA